LLFVSGIVWQHSKVIAINEVLDFIIIVITSTFLIFQFWTVLSLSPLMV
jgi:hypothetical protein